MGEDPAATAERLMQQALQDAHCPGELPELVWVYQAPGHEEQVMAGLRAVVGDRCPIIGGSSADNEIAGGWRQMSTEGIMTNGVVVAALFPSGGVSYGFQGGYEPAGPVGMVTAVSVGDGAAANAASRHIRTIDGRPAAVVYNEWTGGMLSARMAAGGNILVETTMAPLGVEIDGVHGVPQYRLIHPESISPDGVLSTFCAVECGTELHMMRGDRSQLVQRAGKVAKFAKSGLAGGLVVYCAGCKIAIDSRVDEMASGVAESLSGQPFLGCFTFGEQGCMVGQNFHGNLMISTVAFGR